MYTPSVPRLASIALGAAVLCVLLGLSGAARATIYPSSPLSGVISIQFDATAQTPTNNNAVGTITTKLTLTKAGKVDIHVQKAGKYNGIFDQHGKWTSTVDVSYPEDCHSVHAAGTYSGQAVVFS